MASELSEMQQLADQCVENKDKFNSLYSEALDTQEQLKELQQDIGDCDIGLLISKRKNELQNFTNKAERLKKDVQNLRKAKKSCDSPEDCKITPMIKELEFKLKTVDKDRIDLLKVQHSQFDSVQPKHFEDLEIVVELLKKIRQYKNQISEAE